MATRIFTTQIINTYWYCPACDSVKEHICYLENENVWTVEIRFICTGKCNHSESKRFIKSHKNTHKVAADIVQWHCPSCRKVTQNIIYLENLSSWTLTFRLICLAMDCNHSYSRHFLRGDMKQEE